MLSEERKTRIKEKLLNTKYGYFPIEESTLMDFPNPTHELVRSKIDVARLDGFPTEIDEDDLLAGRWPVLRETEEEKAEREALAKEYGVGNRIDGARATGTGHKVVDYEKLLEKGIHGVLAEVRERLAAVTFSDPDCAEKKSFYRACIGDLEAVIRLQERYHAEAVRLWEKETDPARKKELENMMRTLERVPANPAETFREAIQSMWLLQLAIKVVQDKSLTGRPDHYLYPYYRKDMDEGRITDDEVFELIEDLYFKTNNLYGSWPAAVMLGGRNRKGEPVWNELSYMFVRAIETTGLVNPSVAVCYNEYMPEDLLDLCLEMVGKGYTRPSIFNDDIVIKGLRDAGVSEEDSYYYVHSTCVEITPIAASNILVATPYINLNKGFEYVLGGGEKMFGSDCRLREPVSVDLNTLDTFDKFCEQMKSVIANMLKGEMEYVQNWVLCRKRYGSLPLVSCFTNDCLALGKDSANDGARYSFIYPCFPGFINFVDSLSAIKKAVYEKKLVTLSELGEILKNNFADTERLRAYLRNKCPKFGNDIDESDELLKEMFLFLKEELGQFGSCVRNGTFHPSYFAYIMHGVLGSESAASPDGRLQGEALSECLGAVQGMDRNGPLALMNSVSKIPQVYGIGGIATNFRFSKKLMQENFGEIKTFVKEFMRKGNFEAQFNIVDQATLLDAMEHPESYRTLLVRVAGYSDYFVNLSPIIQREIISRLEHDGM